ncbi:hypothetical protein BS47DRAFT_1146902 [Hydnum rufescens UP504]|uniref:Uncharacterized protein n=1 Tax=Hydnum rufescens UP504 TaxID=1448309 RepID=A0A9P6ATK5_9AGAM|nr:hypothetical protein BS47DRAFT_1146902 [Hydnum rufescens UP504]
MREYTLFNPLSSQALDNDSLSSRAPSIAASTLSIVSRLRNRIFNPGHASPRHSVLDDNDASSFYSGASSAGESTGSTSTIATATAPSFPPTPPSRPLESTFPPPCTIPLTEIHNHTGTFYYLPTTSPSPHRLQIALPSSSSRIKAKSLRSTRDPTVVTTTQPAIFIVPPEDVPAEVYLPSIPMNTPRYSKSSIPPSSFAPAFNPRSVVRGAKTGDAGRSGV